MFKLFLNVVIVFLIFFVEVAYVNCIKRIYIYIYDDELAVQSRVLPLRRKIKTGRVRGRSGLKSPDDINVHSVRGRTSVATCPVMTVAPCSLCSRCIRGLRHD